MLPTPFEGAFSVPFEEVSPLHLKESSQLHLKKPTVSQLHPKEPAHWHLNIEISRLEMCQNKRKWSWPIDLLMS